MRVGNLAGQQQLWAQRGEARLDTLLTACPLVLGPVCLWPSAMQGQHSQLPRELDQWPKQEAEHPNRVTQGGLWGHTLDRSLRTGAPLVTKGRILCGRVRKAGASLLLRNRKAGL